MVQLLSEMQSRLEGQPKRGEDGSDGPMTPRRSQTSGMRSTSPSSRGPVVDFMGSLGEDVEVLAGVVEAQHSAGSATS